MRSPGDERKAGKRLGELYAEHAAAVYAYAFHLLGTREEAEDVVQIAFLHAHRSLVRGEELVHPRAWLSTVVKRQAFNRWRDRRELPVEDPAVHQQTTEPGEAAEKLSQVRAVLFSLPEAQHQAFVLRHWSGLSTREIGQVLGTTESAAESLLVRARASIMAADQVAADCVAIRERLAGMGELSSPQVRHVATCSGCSRAQQRLTRIAAAAVVLGLLPHAHVAQALAASVPGFTVAGASAGAGAATGAGLAAKGAVAKVAASLVISAVAVTAVAPLALHAAHRLHDGPVAGPVRARSVVHAATVAQVSPGARQRGFAVTGNGTSGDTTGPSTKDGGSGTDGGGASSDGSSSQSSGSSDGSGGSAGSSQTSSGDGTGQSGSDGSGDGGSGNVTSGDGSTSTDGGSTSGDSQGSSTDGSGGQ